MSVHCLGAESQRDGNSSESFGLQFVEYFKGPRSRREAVSAEGNTEISFYDVYGRPSINNDLFNSELIVLYLDEEWVNHIGFSF